MLAAVVLLGGCRGELSPEFSADSFAISEGALLVAACSSCHFGEGGDMANLSGWAAEDMTASLLSYKMDEDGITVMHRLARGYTDAEIELISQYFGQKND